MWPPSPALLGTNTSYPEPIAIPDSQPGDAPTMCVPINQAWIPIVAGALQQLAQTNIWAGMSEADALAAVGAAWDLIAAVANASACTVFSLQFTMGCTLQYSTDGGETWTDVPGWDDYFAACVGGTTGGGGGAPVPAIPDITPEALACSVAGYLVQTLLRQVVQKTVQKILDSGIVTDVLDTIVALIPGIDAISPLIILATNKLFGDITTIGADDVAAALTDLVWSKLGCVIFNAIGSFTGWTLGLISDVKAAITGSGLAPSLILNALANWIGNLGVPGLSSATAPAGLQPYDCSQCGMGGTQIQSGPAGLQQIPNLTVTDGPHTVTPTGMLTFVGATVTGPSPNATVTITPGGPSGATGPTGPAGDPGGGALSGSVSVTVPAGNVTGTSAVSFPSTLPDAPIVVCVSADGTLTAQPLDITNSGFTAQLTIGTEDSSDHTATVLWIAAISGGGGTAIGVPFDFTTPPDLSMWTWTNQAGASLAQTASSQSIVTVGTGGDSWNILTTSAPGATPWTITAAFVFNLFDIDFQFAGIVLLDSGTGQFIDWGLARQGSYQAGPLKWNSFNSYNSDYTRVEVPYAQVLWFQVVNDGSTLTCNFSLDGVNWLEWAAATVTDFLPLIDQIGIGIDSNTTSPAVLTLVSWDVS